MSKIELTIASYILYQKKNDILKYIRGEGIRVERRKLEFQNYYVSDLLTDVRHV